MASGTSFFRRNSNWFTHIAKPVEWMKYDYVFRIIICNFREYAICMWLYFVPVVQHSHLFLCNLFPLKLDSMPCACVCAHFLNSSSSFFLLLRTLLHLNHIKLVWMVKINRLLELLPRTRLDNKTPNHTWSIPNNFRLPITTRQLVYFCTKFFHFRMIEHLPKFVCYPRCRELWWL